MSFVIEVRFFAKSILLQGHGPLTHDTPTLNWEEPVYPFGRFAGPARRSAPWGSVDREIHQIEFARYPGATLGWRNDGAPTFVWRHDWDSGLD
ncbi:hypothetical protein [Micrococcus luteus]|uniref:hypothetical protein n=1 Tax=Micrococcus luteus TaxID=1270 RepID=UPI0011306E98|nr:hypothetical protein [Micrococcus luteus]QCY44417.1 hypothetical protein ERB44_04135 [Micrococcus luteus]